MPICNFKIRNKFNPIVIPTLSKLKMINKIGRFSALNPKRGIDQIVSKTIITPIMEMKDGSLMPRIIGEIRLRNPYHTKKKGMPVKKSDAITLVKMAFLSLSLAGT
jgi:hypothetical protein